MCWGLQKQYQQHYHLVAFADNSAPAEERHTVQIFKEEVEHAFEAAAMDENHTADWDDGDALVGMIAMHEAAITRSCIPQQILSNRCWLLC